jgi:hypothetical protein
MAIFAAKDTDLKPMELLSSIAMLVLQQRANMRLSDEYTSSSKFKVLSALPAERNALKNFKKMRQAIQAESSESEEESEGGE